MTDTTQERVGDWTNEELVRACNVVARCGTDLNDDLYERVREAACRLSTLEELARDAKQALESSGAAWVDPMGYQESDIYRRLRRALDYGGDRE